VAGTIAAGENGAGIIGVAPDALVMPLRVLDANGGGRSSDVAAAFDFAGDRGVRVVNASLGSAYPSNIERLAIQNHPNTLYVVAAGNGGADSVGDDNDGATREYPCAHDVPNLICVGATDATDARAGFSNYGAASVDLFAPGQDIVSDWARGHATVLNQYFGVGDGYEIMLGTSMAAPHVAGAAALAGAVRPSWGALSLKSALLDGADRLPGLAGLSVTGARLNAGATARLAAGLPPDPGPDSGSLGPEVPALGEETERPAPPAPARPRITSVRLQGKPRVCRGRRACQARTATLSFVLGADADIKVRLQRRTCVRTTCRWRPTERRTRREPAGRTRWTVGPSLLGMRLRPGRWRVTLATSAGSAAREFRVR
jgi:subtilisin family serine protease